jgi:protein-tyrosine-phosphatase
MRNTKKIETVDPFIVQYAYEKETRPETPLVWRQFKREDVDAVDRLVELAHGHREEIVTQSDWEVFGSLFNFWASKWPMEYQEFKKEIKNIRQSRKKEGYSESREILYVGTLPARLMRIVKAIFPRQQFNKKFVWKMIKKFPLFKVTKEGN